MPIDSGSTRFRSRSSAGPADRDQLSVDGRFDAATGDRPETRGERHGQPAFVGGGDDGSGQRVLAVGFDRGREREHLVFGQTVADDSGHDVMAGRERAGLVEQHGVDGAHALERKPVLDQMPARAARPVDTAMVSGIASPSAWGHAITRTVTVRSTACVDLTERQSRPRT